MKLGIDLSSPGQDMTPPLTRTEVQAEVHVSACSAEQVDASASVGLGSAGALSSADLRESVEEFSWRGHLERNPCLSWMSQLAHLSRLGTLEILFVKELDLKSVKTQVKLQGKISLIVLKQLKRCPTEE